jgi:hypothetical protein
MRTSIQMDVKLRLETEHCGFGEEDMRHAVVAFNAAEAEHAMRAKLNGDI